jgi:hypothetical protein
MLSCDSRARITYNKLGIHTPPFLPSSFQAGYCLTFRKFDGIKISPFMETFQKVVQFLILLGEDGWQPVQHGVAQPFFRYRAA